MELFGYLASVLIGIALGLIGGGGSILTVPVLVYLFGVDAVSATAYSLAIVGATSLLGSVDYFRQGLVNLRTAVIFGIPSIVAVYLTRAYVVPAIPDVVLTLGEVSVSKGLLLLMLFALLMLLASYSMIRKDKPVPAGTTDAAVRPVGYPLILAEGILVGTLTGLVGAGGGFLIIPALVVLGKLPMRQAVGTSLVIIAAKSLIGFAGEPSGEVNYILLGSITALAIGGIYLGTRLARRIDGSKLKPAFGWFVLLMGITMIARELITTFI